MLSGLGLRRSLRLFYPNTKGKYVNYYCSIITDEVKMYCLVCHQFYLIKLHLLKKRCHLGSKYSTVRNHQYLCIKNRLCFFKHVKDVSKNFLVFIKGLKFGIERRPFLYQSVVYEPGRSVYKIACAPSEESDQPARSRSLIRLFAVRLKTLWFLDYQQNALRRPIRLCSWYES